MAENPFASPEEDYSRFGSATSNLPRVDNHTNYGRSAHQATPNPPRYSEVFSSRAAMERPWYNPRGWSGRRKLIIGACVVVVIVAVIVGAVEGVKANAYPNYTQLNYTLVDTYSGSSFFNNFEYYTSTDPTNGWVQYVYLGCPVRLCQLLMIVGKRYVDSQTASMTNLTYASDSTAVIKVDTDAQNQTSGRKSVRITSTNTYDSGLFIFDVVHTPYGCATWPALWLTDPSNWPEHGEIDVIESNNKGTHGNDITLHTTSGCKMNAKRKETGTAQYSNCLNTANDNAGCSVKGRTATYGEAFNDNGGGVSPENSQSTALN